MDPKPSSTDSGPSSRASLLISLAFHAVVLGALVFFAAREGLLGEHLRKITVEMVKEKPPEKPKEPEKPKVEPPRVENAKVMDIPKPAPAPEVARAPAAAPVQATAPPAAIAPPPAEVPSFDFEGGKTVRSSSDPVQLYRALVEYTLRSKWDRPEGLADDNFIAEVEVSIDRAGQISNPDWKKGSGNARWDDSVRRAVAATPRLDRPPPTNFPPRVLVRFDVQETTEPIIQ